MKSSPLARNRNFFRGVNGSETDEGAMIFFEQFKALRAKLEYQADLKKIKVLAVTSSIAEEGKSCTCANLATNLASIGRKKVLLVDADLRKSDLAQYMNVSRKPGLTELLSGSVAIDKIIHKPMEGLYFIPGGERTNGASDLLAGEKFRYFLDQMRKQFDLILLDTPPVLPVADTMSLQDQIDGFIIVFRMGFTPYVMLRQVVEEMEKEKVIGVVLNRVEPQTQKYYKRYYGKYYQKISR